MAKPYIYIVSATLHNTYNMTRSLTRDSQGTVQKDSYHANITYIYQAFRILNFSL